MSKNESGVTLFGPVGLAICAGMGYLSFKMSISLVPNDAKFATPWVMASIFMAPLVYIVAVKNKYYDLVSLDGLTNREKRRLSVRVRRKVILAWVAVAFNFLSAVFSIIVMAFFASDLDVFKKMFPVIGGLLRVSLFLMGLFFADSHKVSLFISEIKNREDDRKRKAKFFKGREEKE